jgi:kynurenine formamidase
MSSTVTFDTVVNLFQELSNWGRWGSADRLGTLNYITPRIRADAARLATEGIVVPCALTIDPASANSAGKWGPPQRITFQVRGAGAHRLTSVVEHLGLVYHGRGVTHIDAPAHISWDERLYNDVPATVVQPEQGAEQLSVLEACGGIVTRGVLVDVAARHSVDLFGSSYSVTVDDIEAALRSQGTSVQSGDAVILRTGGRKDGVLPETTFPGWGVDALPWLHRHEVAVIGCDTAQDARPGAFADIAFPVHAVGLVAMGLWMIDNCSLDALAATCSRLGRWDFLFCVAPNPFAGATGGPVNPLAVF